MTEVKQQAGIKLKTLTKSEMVCGPDGCNLAAHYQDQAKKEQQ